MVRTVEEINGEYLNVMAAIGEALIDQEATAGKLVQLRQRRGQLIAEHQRLQAAPQVPPPKYDIAAETSTNE